MLFIVSIQFFAAIYQINHYYNYYVSQQPIHNSLVCNDIYNATNKVNVTK